MTTDTHAPVTTPRRRPHSAAFKRRVLAECAAPGASIAAVALAHGLNANLVHTWRRRDKRARRGVAALGPAAESAEAASAAAQFVPLALPAPAPAVPPEAAADISIEVKRGADAMAIR